MHRELRPAIASVAPARFGVNLPTVQPDQRPLAHWHTDRTEVFRRDAQIEELAHRIGITEQNLSILKTGKAKAVRLTTLDAICKALDCQPGDLLEYRP